jgi:hypothetical protein
VSSLDACEFALVEASPLNQARAAIADCLPVEPKLEASGRFPVQDYAGGFSTLAVSS